MTFLDRIRGAFKSDKESPKEGYVEIDINKDQGKKAKILIRPFVLREFEDVDKILNFLREGFTIALIDIKQIKSRDIIELKRAISKIKKTCDALEGSVAGFGENIIIATPSFVKIYRGEKTEKVEKL